MVFPVEVLLAAGDNIPNWIHSFIDASGLEQIEKSVQEAEVHTQGEIVPMIVRSSSTKRHLPLQIFLMLTILCLIFLKFFTWPILFLGILLSALASPWIAKCPTLQRLLLPKKDQANDVFHRAHYEFSEQGLMNTKDRTGILIFVSLMERRCVVLADKGIATKVDSNIWDDIISDLISEIQRKQAHQGFKIAIQKCGEILTQHLPAQSKNSNELANRLIIRD